MRRRINILGETAFAAALFHKARHRVQLEGPALKENMKSLTLALRFTYFSISRPSVVCFH